MPARVREAERRVDGLPAGRQDDVGTEPLVEALEDRGSERPERFSALVQRQHSSTSPVLAPLTPLESRVKLPHFGSVNPKGVAVAT